MNIVNWLNNVNERRKGKEREGERGKVWREERYVEGKEVAEGRGGNRVDRCPVGALTGKEYEYKGRPWERKGRKGKARKRKERKGKARKRKERKGKARKC